MEGSVLVDRVKEMFGDALTETTVFRGEVTHVVKKDRLVELVRFIKTDAALLMDFPVDVLGVDYHPRRPRFEVVYHFYSTVKKHRLRLKVRVDDGESVPSLTHIYQGLNWPERETYDMFGIVFDGHPNLKRIYMPQDWEGHPLRKDYPLRGYKDRYNPYGEERKK